MSDKRTSIAVKQSTVERIKEEKVARYGENVGDSMSHEALIKELLDESLNSN